MIIFSKKQEVFEIGNVKLGGQLGELPTVLIGSIFHHGHKIVKDEVNGEFDKLEAEKLINTQDEFSYKTGNPCMVDVVGKTSKALIKYIDFVADITDTPLLINGLNAEVRLNASKHAISIGLNDRIIYNSINYTLNEYEIKSIREVGIKSAIIQAFNPHNPLPNLMVEVLKGEKGLIEKAKRAGISKMLILTPVIDIPHIGCSAKGIWLIKEKFGLPTGTAPIGVLSKWTKANEFGKDVLKLCRAVPLAICQTMGANFIIYGSLAKAKNIFPAVALADAIIAYNSRFMGVKVSKEHPINKIFKIN